MTPRETLVRSLYDTIGARASAAAVAAHWHPDAEQVEMPSTLRPDGHRRPLGELLAGYAAGLEAIGQQSYDVLAVVDDGERLAVQLRWAATTAVTLGALPAGTDLVAHVAAFYEFRDGLILRQTSYDCYERLPSGHSS